MNINAGTLLISNTSLKDDYFEQSVILITEHSNNGATGFVINNLFTRVLNDLEEFKHINPFKLYDGGPVDKEHLFFIHRRPDLIPDGTLLFDDIYFGGDFKKAVNNIKQKKVTATDIKIFVGYCGWDNNQLQEEMEEGSWLIVTANSHILFDTSNHTLWQTLYTASNKKA